MLADTDRAKSLDLNESNDSTTFSSPADDLFWNVKFAYPAGDLPPSAYTFSLLGTLCKTMCCGGKTSAYGKSWKFPKNMIQFQQFGAEWL